MFDNFNFDYDLWLEENAPLNQSSSPDEDQKKEKEHNVAFSLDSLDSLSRI